jgi:Tetratricopeptide repeat
MPKNAYLTCLWPGLARIWWAGDLRSLFIAILFGALLNCVAYFSAFPQFGVAETYVMLGWVAVISWWGASIHSAFSELPFLMGMAVKLSKPGDLAEAQVAYLKRDFVATESIIGKILTTEPGDPAPRLLLAATYRQTGRISEARGLLSSLQREPAAFAWQFEIEADLARLERLEKATPPEVSSSPEVESKPRVVKASSADEPSSTVARRAATRRAA